MGNFLVKINEKQLRFKKKFVYIQDQNHLITYPCTMV